MTLIAILYYAAGMHHQKHHFPYTPIAVEAAMAAGRILKQGFGTHFAVSSKESINDLVTEFDKKAEDAIIQYIKDHFPSHAILAEESGGTAEGKEICWIIDPLDGTMNFAHQIPIFCVSIGIRVENEIVAGVIFDPMQNELFVVEKGFGSFLNNNPIRVSSQKDVRRAVVASGFPYGPGPLKQAGATYFVHFLENDVPVRIIGSAALTLAYIAAGRFDIYCGSNLKPWDAAAGSLLVNESGGKLTGFDGLEYDLFRVPNVVATNTSLHHHALQFFQ